MNKLITDMELVSYLENIKNELHAMDFVNDGRVVFLNLDSFYYYADDLSIISRGRKSDLKKWVSAIEDFIPINISENQLELFLRASSSKDNSLIDNIDQYFNKITKIAFLNSIYQARSEQSWNEILRVCRSMRNFYEESIPQKSLYSSYLSKFF